MEAAKTAEAVPSGWPDLMFEDVRGKGAGKEGEGRRVRTNLEKTAHHARPVSSIPIPNWTLR